MFDFLLGEISTTDLDRFLESKRLAELLGILGNHFKDSAKRKRMASVAVLNAIDLNATMINAYAKSRDVVVHCVHVVHVDVDGLAAFPRSRRRRHCAPSVPSLLPSLGDRYFGGERMANK